MSSHTTFPEAVGTFLADFRNEHNLTFDQVARAARDYGASWSASSVRNIENGKAVTSLQNLLCLGLALHSLTDVELTLSDMLGDAEAFSVPSALELPVKRSWIDSALGGGIINIDDVSNLVGGNAKADQIIKDLPNIVERAVAELPRRRSLREHDALEKRTGSPSLAEERAAQNLGIKPNAVRAWALELWGKDLEQEASERAEERTKQTGKHVTPQARGAMTRALLKEIEAARAADAAERTRRKSDTNGAS